MKIQLTKDKVIDVSLFGGGKKKSATDMVGVELFSSCTAGCPAVRIRRKKSEWLLEAAGYVSAPDGDMPKQWEDVSRQPTWSLPSAFQSSCAAIAVNTTMGAFGQASPDAILQEMIHGVSASAAQSEASAASSGRRRFGIKRGESPALASQSQGDESSATLPKNASLPPDGAEPVSSNGRRFAIGAFAEEGFKLCASIPEFQALWLGRLLPEGRRPTASSIQLAESALMASVIAQPELAEAKGNAIVVFVRQDSVYFGGYKGGESVLWRKCPGVRGYRAMRDSVIKNLGVGEDLVDAVLEDSLIDPRPALEPFVHPVLEQLELARAYLSSKHGISGDRIFIVGLPHGVEHWRHYAEESLKLQLVALDPFAGLVLGKGVKAEKKEDFMVALGAALAATEAET